MRGGPRGFRPGFPCPAVLRSSSRKAARFRLRDCYPLWFDVPVDSANAQLCNFPTRRQTDQDEPYNPCTTTAAAYHVAQVWARSLFARHYSGSRGFFPFLRVLRCFSSPACLYAALFYSGRSTRALPRAGFPIRKSSDQRMVSSFPRLIAAAHVLHRLLAPRHPPCALRHLTRKNTFYCRYGVFKVHAGRLNEQTPTRRPAPNGRSLKTQQRERRARRCSRRVGFPDGLESHRRVPTPSERSAPVSLERR